MNRKPNVKRITIDNYDYECLKEIHKRTRKTFKLLVKEALQDKIAKEFAKFPKKMRGESHER